jgi:hypothetical protein
VYFELKYQRSKCSNTFSHKNDSIWIASRIVTASTYGRTQLKSITIAHLRLATGCIIEVIFPPKGNSKQRPLQSAIRCFAKPCWALIIPLHLSLDGMLIDKRLLKNEKTSETLISLIYLKFVSFSKLFLVLPLELGLHSLNLFSKLYWAEGLRCQ